MITPTLANLPVYVRAGSIIPISPLTQNTEEIPNGPLTLRVYAGDNCHGTLYQDDGKRGFALSCAATVAEGEAGEGGVGTLLDQSAREDLPDNCCRPAPPGAADFQL